MSAPIGNQFWRQRSSHGRDKLFSTPEVLEEAAYEYFQWSDENPWMRVEKITPIVTKDTIGETTISTVHSTTHLPTARPYTLKGLCLFLNVGETYFRDFKSTNKDEGFSSVISRIEDIIYTQKFEGAVVGAFNANIISRDLGLVDKREIDARLDVQQITGMVVK